MLAYKKACELAKKVFHISKRFSLTDQARRSSRSVCTNIAEAFRRKRYIDYFISKLNDAETENTETGVLFDFQKDCGYKSLKEFEELTVLNDEVGKLL